MFCLFVCVCVFFSAFFSSLILLEQGQTTAIQSKNTLNREFQSKRVCTDPVQNFSTKRNLTSEPKLERYLYYHSAQGNTEIQRNPFLRGSGKDHLG